ncbi:hypothetical protein T8A63_15190 [Sulfitobacter sp. OXR-159]|uniref:hypothetical protein n=1 Tax=Sulfitobacter sp. OXR-159 TaxID=3100174 RepID=UPI002AC8F1B1|nr:hypothetical protein [Sulfitobacter sp. OXR-159]WPZ28958.1 hypothetical protein T8A63_15190 [Sulfitobacter sp. OXR-159]
MVDWVVVLLSGAGLVLAYMVVRGFTPHAFHRDQSPTYRLSVGIALVVVSYVARSIYWEFTPLVIRSLDPSWWSLWFGMTGTAVNIVFSLIFLRGLYHLLVLLWLLIPARERRNWSIWQAPWFPDHNAFTRTVAQLRRRVGAKRGGRND